MDFYDYFSNRYRCQDFSALQSKSELSVSTLRRVALETGLALIAAFFLEHLFSYIMAHIAVSILGLLPESDIFWRTAVIYLYSNCATYLPKLAVFGVLFHRFKPAQHLNAKYENRLYLLPILAVAVFTFGTWGSQVTKAVNYFLQIFFGAGEIPNVMDAIAPTELPQGIAMLISIAVIAPLAEEIIYRRLLMTPLRVLGDVPAVVLSSLIFGLMHGNFDQFCYGFFGGIIFGLTVIRYGSVKHSIALHAFHNLLVTMITYSDVLTSGNEVWAAVCTYLTRLGEFIVLLSYYGGPLIALVLILSGTAKLEQVGGEDKYKKLRTAFCPALIVGMALALTEFM
ncbi:MAG: CPBP family intramembrane metalloprotease [Eubacterium sp.]|nr:CPBP family intramembrane metalloprotease [Eubacterium sp.]